MSERPTLASPPNRPVSALICYFAYLSALTVGVLTWWLLQKFTSIGLFYIGLITTCTSTVVVWIFSISVNNSSIYDPYWVIAPPFLAIGMMIGSGGFTNPWSFRYIIIIVCILLWAARYHIFYRWTGWRTGLIHEDWRYEDMRDFPVPYWLNSLFGMHLFPTILVYFAFAPGILSLEIPTGMQNIFSVFDAIGIVVAVSSLALLFFADMQLKRFRETDEYKQGGILREGLWKYSRHPNYLGEVLIWVSMMFFGIAAGLHTTVPILVFVGPVVMAVFFRFSSWLMDVRSLERRPGYKIVMTEVSAMIPWFPRVFPKKKTENEPIKNKK